jgi:hypothetical protein
MNEILQKRIEEAAKEYSDLNYIDECVEVPAFIEGATFALQNQWISVEEALPPYDDRLKAISISIDVIVRNEYGKVTSAWYDYANKLWHLLYGEIAGDDVIDSKITHWAHIPSLEGGE